MAEQERLAEALRNRLDALTRKSEKTALDIHIASASIFADLSAEQAKLKPPRSKYLEDIRNWKMGVEGFSPPFDRDAIAALVRATNILRSSSKETPSVKDFAIKASVGITYNSLPSMERRAVDIVMGTRRAARDNDKEVASTIAKKVRSDWLTPVPAIVHGSENRVLSIKNIVTVALPYLDEIAGSPISVGMPHDDYDPAQMDPPGCGALLAIVRMAHPKAGFDHVSDVIRKIRSAK